MPLDEAAAPIHSIISLDELEAKTYRSKTVLPRFPGARGIYGGTVISQAAWAATLVVGDERYGLHSLHAYFLIAGDDAVPITYTVEELRSGKSYRTYLVRASQRSRPILVLSCSFSLPEPHQPHWQIAPAAVSAFPVDVRPPEALKTQVEFYARVLRNPAVHGRRRRFFEMLIKGREKGPFEIKTANLDELWTEEGVEKQSTRAMYWIRYKGKIDPSPAFLRIAIAYASDDWFIGTAASALNLQRVGGESPLAMLASIDHTLWFYDVADMGEAGDWLLFTSDALRTGHGRATVQGRVWTRSGQLLALVQQEGVCRTTDPGRIGGAKDAKL